MALSERAQAAWTRRLDAQRRRPTRRLVAELFDGVRRDRVVRTLALGGRAWLPSLTKPVVTALCDKRRPSRAVWAAEVLCMMSLPTRSKGVALAEALLPVLSRWWIQACTLGRFVESLAPLITGLDQRTRLARALLAGVGRVLLEHPTPDVRADAVYTLGQYRTSGAARLLRLAVRDRGEFWGGRVGDYARAYLRVCVGNDRTALKFQFEQRSPAWHRRRRRELRVWAAQASARAETPSHG